MDEIIIDGSLGEGGGQVLRTSLSLSAITGRAVRLVNIRAGRPKPGLQPQHLASVRAAARICSGAVDGAFIGSREIAFRPGPVAPGDYTFDVAEERGSAGSSALVFQTVLLPLALAGGTSHLRLAGGTHNPWAPPYPYLERVFLPLARLLGVECVSSLERAGWYPVGQGCFAAEVRPGAVLRTLELDEWRKPERLVIYSASLNLPEHVRQRQADQAVRRLRARGLRAHVEMEDLPSPGTGSILLLIAEYEGHSAGFTGLGARGKPAERVADEACDAFVAHHEAKAPVDPHLADQIVLPLALAPGTSSFRTSEVTRHLLTNLTIITQFLPVRYTVEGEEGRPGRVSILGAGLA